MSVSPATLYQGWRLCDCHTSSWPDLMPPPPPPGPLQPSQFPPASSLNFSTWRQDALGMRTSQALLNAFPRLARTPGSSMVVHRPPMHLAATWCMSSPPGSLLGPEIQHPLVSSGPLCLLLALTLPGVFTLSPYHSAPWRDSCSVVSPPFRGICPSLTLLLKLPEGQRDSSVGEGTCQQVWSPEFGS